MWSYGLLCSLKICDFEKYKTEKNGFQSYLFTIILIKQTSCQKITQSAMLGIKFSLETFTGSSTHFCDCDFVKISKLKKIHPHNVFRLYLSLRSCTEASGFDVGRHIWCIQKLIYPTHSAWSVTIMNSNQGLSFKIKRGAMKSSYRTPKESGRGAVCVIYNENKWCKNSS